MPRKPNEILERPPEILAPGHTSLIFFVACINECVCECACMLCSACMHAYIHEVDSIVLVLDHACADRQDVGIEDDVRLREVDLRPHKQVICTLADAHLVGLVGSLCIRGRVGVRAGGGCTDARICARVYRCVGEFVCTHAWARARAWPSSSNAITTTAEPCFLTIFACLMNSSSPPFNEIELTIHLPWTHLRPASTTWNFDESTMIGTCTSMPLHISVGTMAHA